MFQLRRFLVPLAAFSGALAYSIGPQAFLPIVSEKISPDGYTRP